MNFISIDKAVPDGIFVTVPEIFSPVNYATNSTVIGLPASGIVFVPPTVINISSVLVNSYELIELMLGIGAVDTALKFGPVIVFVTNSFKGSF